MSETMTGVVAVPRQRTVDEIKLDINRRAVLARRIVRRAVETAKDKDEIFKIDVRLGVT